MALFDLVDVRRLYVTAEILRKTLVANTSDEFGILQKKNQNSGWKRSCSWLQNSSRILIFFETGAMSTPTKSPNPTVLSQGGLASAQ